MPLPLSPFAIQAGIQVGGALLGRLMAGRRPDVGDYIPEQDIMAELGRIQQEQFRQGSSALAVGSRRAIEDLKAAGATGSGLGTSLSDIFSQAGDSLNALGAQQADERIRAQERSLQRETAIGLQEYQGALESRAARAEGVAQMAGSIGDFFSAQQLIDDMGSRDATLMDSIGELIRPRAEQSPQATPINPAPAGSIVVKPMQDGKGAMGGVMDLLPNLGMSLVAGFR